MPETLAMIFSIHQPNYLPYLGFFKKIAESDLFILFDTAQYVKNDYHNRNRIKTPQGAVWLTIPLASKDCYKKRICDVPLPSDASWTQKQWKTIAMAYSNAPFFEEHKHFFENLYAHPPQTLLELNESIIHYLLD